MKALMIIGVVLVVLGICALGFQSFTFFTQERVVDTGFFHVDVNKPHTIIINPIVGGVAVVAGLLMIFAGRRETSA